MMLIIYQNIVLMLLVGYGGLSIVYVRRMFKEKGKLPPASQDVFGPAKYWARNGDKWAKFFITYHWVFVSSLFGLLLIRFIK